MKIIFSMLAVGLLLAFGSSAQSGETPASSSLSLLKAVPQAELPGKAAALVSGADAKSQAKIAVDVVKAAIGLNPAAARAIVGSICAATPSVADLIAATAAELLPQQAAQLAQVAAAAAPKMAGKIVTAVCKVAPNAYKAIAEAVASVVPDASREILAGVAAALPELKDTLASILKNYKATSPSVSVVLAQVATDSGSVATLASGAPVAHGGSGPAFNPLSGTPTVTTPTGGGTVPSGGRDYSAPPPP